jgi:hypothetical protein
VSIDVRTIDLRDAKRDATPTTPAFFFSHRGDGGIQKGLLFFCGTRNAPLIQEQLGLANPLFLVCKHRDRDLRESRSAIVHGEMFLGDRTHFFFAERSVMSRDGAQRRSWLWDVVSFFHSCMGLL